MAVGRSALGHHLDRIVHQLHLTVPERATRASRVATPWESPALSNYAAVNRGCITVPDIVEITREIRANGHSSGDFPPGTIAELASQARADAHEALAREKEPDRLVSRHWLKRLRKVHPYQSSKRLCRRWRQPGSAYLWLRTPGILCSVRAVSCCALLLAVALVRSEQRLQRMSPGRPI